MSEYRFCPQCATPLALLAQMEDGGEKQRLRCPACAWTHWNNPTPVLAAVVEYQGRILLARNAAWTNKMYALITGFMEAGETPAEGIAREIAEETNLRARSLDLFAFEQVRCWPAGTGHALADWLRSRGYEPQYMEPPARPA